MTASDRSEARCRHLIEGSVRKQGDRVRIVAELISAADGRSLWSETYDRDLKDVFAVQSEIAKAVADQMKVKLLGQSAQPESAAFKRKSSRPTTQFCSRIFIFNSRRLIACERRSRSCKRRFVWIRTMRLPMPNSARPGASTLPALP